MRTSTDASGGFKSFDVPYLLACKTGIFPRDFGLKLEGPSYR